VQLDTRDRRRLWWSRRCAAGDADRRGGSPRRLLRHCSAAVALIALLGGCGKQSITSTKSPDAHDIALLWWWMLAAAVVVLAGALALLFLAWRRRGKPGLPIFGEREQINEGMVLLFGVAIPIVALTALFAVANVYLVNRTAPPKPSSTAMTVNVIGHQWWWEVRYPGTSAVTANEIHIPVNTRVNVVATTADVIHSFWVPALNRKVDMVPGLHNRVLLYSSRVGKFRGQCSQFCGLQHAHMSFWVFVDSVGAFRTWLLHEAAPASPPRGAAARAGQRVFMTSACASCHEIRGTGATATVGPDLTHLSGRTSIAALTLPNTPSVLASWIHNPQTTKPGDRMPDLGLQSTQVSELVSYLEELR
jgi:cytochrome c oxidase subunit 2